MKQRKSTFVVKNGEKHVLSANKCYFCSVTFRGRTRFFSSNPLTTIKENTLIHIYMNKRIKSVSLVLFLLGLPLATAQATSSPVETVEIVQQTTTCKGHG